MGTARILFIFYRESPTKKVDMDGYGLLFLFNTSISIPYPLFCKMRRKSHKGHLKPCRPFSNPTRTHRICTDTGNDGSSRYGRCSPLAKRPTKKWIWIGYGLDIEGYGRIWIGYGSVEKDMERIWRDMDWIWTNPYPFHVRP
jgi:hypothetical protein